MIINLTEKELEVLTEMMDTTIMVEKNLLKTRHISQMEMQIYQNILAKLKQYERESN